MAAVLNHSRAKGTAKLVLLGIANHAGDGGAWPTVATLARYANVTERAVQQAIGQLQRLGELLVERQAGGLAHMKNYERPNRYTVMVSCPPTCDGTSNHRLRSYPQPVQLALVDPVKLPSPGEAAFTPPGEADFTHNRTNNHPSLQSVEKVTTTRARETPADPAVRAAAIASARAGLRGES